MSNVITPLTWKIQGFSPRYVILLFCAGNPILVLNKFVNVTEVFVSNLIPFDKAAKAGTVVVGDVALL